jgi:hypothetical protein
MPNVPRQQAFDREFRSHLEPFTAALVSELRGITTATPPAEVKILSFEVQADWRRFPVHAFAMDDESPDEVYHEPPFYGPLLMGSGPLVPDGAIDQDAYEDAGIATFERGARVLAEWFGECWHEAGGATFPIPAYINLHDSDAYYDLRARRWVSESDIWP